MKTLTLSLCLALAAAMFVAAPSHAQRGKTSMANAYAYSFDGIDGGQISLSDYRGNAVLIVNVASQCGYTPQYEGLEELYQAYKDKGLVIIGVPANDFGGQEPGSNEDIKEFSHSKFSVTFPMAAKTSVVGNAAHPFYRWAAEAGQTNLLANIPRWNFHKYLVGPDGSLVRSFDSSITPMSEEMTSAIEAQLKAANP